MSNYQSQVYECSRGDAIWKTDDNSEWINKFSEGIEVKRGDNIRILGSFVHEGNSGEEIEIDKDQQINIAFSPYIQASTLAIDVNTNIVDLSQFSDIPYSSDAFGIEPPWWVEDKKYAETTIDNYNFPTNNETAYGVPLATGQQPIDFGNKICKWYSLNSKLVNPFTGVNREDDIAKTWGNNLNLNNYNVDATNSINKGYKNFTQKTIPQELYISQVVKKFILPFYDGIHTSAYRQFAEMVNNPPDWGTNGGAGGYFNGFPQVGMCIATVDIGGSSGWYDSDGNGYYETAWNIGIPNLKSGVQSLIGTIIAVRPIFHNILGETTGTFEILVSNWVNPSTISNKSYSHQFAGQVQSARSLDNAGTGKTLFKQIHGGNENKQQYSNNPSFNGSNGGYFQYNNTGVTTTLEGGASRDMMSGMATTTYNKNTTLSNQDKVITGSNDNTPNDFQLGYGMPQGTSFLWNGSYNGNLRYSQEFDSTTGAMINNDKPRRARSGFYWERPGGAPAPAPPDAGTNGLWCNIDHLDVALPTTITPGEFFPFPPTEPSPHVMGGYIICSKTTMEAVVRGEVVSENDPNYYSGEAGKIPRVWIEYAHQASRSQYKSRHYVENSWTNTAATGASALPGVLNDNNQRYGYVFAGMPLTINWREATHVPQNLGTNFALGDYYPGGYAETQGIESAGAFKTKGDGMARCWSSNDGKAPVALPAITFHGLPTEWCAYNTCVNSIHFQQKETGDTNLGKNTIILKSKLSVLHVAGAVTIIIPIADTINQSTGVAEAPIPYDLIKVLYPNSLYNDYYPIHAVAIVGLDYHITFNMVRNNYTILVNTPADTIVYIYRNGGLKTGVGINANPWSSDCLMVKESLTKCSVPKGFYTEQQLSEYINTQLHYTNREYAVEMGTKNVDNSYNVPTTIGKVESNICSNPTIINGNFVHTYIPDVTYGFSPITQNVSTGTDLIPTTKDLSNELYTYDVFRGVDPGDGHLTEWEFYWSEEIETLRPYDGNNTRKLSEARLNVIGKHFKLYSIPEIEPNTPNPVNNKNIQLIRLTGGALNVSDYIPPPTPPPVVNGYWNNALRRWCGSYEMLRDKNGNTNGAAGSGAKNYGATYSYPTRLNRNLLSYGGSSKIFCGANNITFEWDEGRNRFSLNNLYTPIRPHLPQTSGADFGNGDAIPSTIINTMYNGFVRGQLTGIYINNLNAGIFDAENWGQAPIGDKYLYDTLTTDQITQLGTNFLNTLGYTEEQLATYDNNFNVVTDIFVYRNETEFSGNAIRVAPKLSTAINGSNPVASRCLNIAPVIQFFVESETDDFFAINVPSKGNSPYYFIGSSFPTKQFFGSKEGAKLPVIGICSRNFHSFNFAFDLGGSSISYTMEEDCLITSIHTKIYNSSLETPANLSPYSSVIYVITRNNYIKDLTPPQEQEAAKMYIESQNPNNIPNTFQTQAPANYRTEPPVLIPPNYNQPSGANFQFNFESDSE